MWEFIVLILLLYVFKNFYHENSFRYLEKKPMIFISFIFIEYFRAIVFIRLFDFLDCYLFKSHFSFSFKNGNEGTFLKVD